MWTLLHRLARPPLAQQLALLAAAADQRLRALVREGDAREPDWPARVQEAAAASATCWQTLRGALGRRRWQVARGSLLQQEHRLQPLQIAAMACQSLQQGWVAALSRHVATPKEQRALERLDAPLQARKHHSRGDTGWRLSHDRAGRLGGLLKARGRCLTRLEQVVTSDEVVLGDLVRIYAKARRQLRQAPRADGARRWAGHQARIWQLLGGSEQLQGGRLQGVAAAAQQLHVLLEQNAWLRSLSQPGAAGAVKMSTKDAARLARLATARRELLRPCVDALAAQAFVMPPEELAALLPWECFRGGVVSCGCAADAGLV